MSRSNLKLWRIFVDKRNGAFSWVLEFFRCVLYTHDEKVNKKKKNLILKNILILRSRLYVAKEKLPQTIFSDWDWTTLLLVGQNAFITIIVLAFNNNRCDKFSTYLSKCFFFVVVVKLKLWTIRCRLMLT